MAQGRRHRSPTLRRSRYNLFYGVSKLRKSPSQTSELRACGRQFWGLSLKQNRDCGGSARAVTLSSLSAKRSPRVLNGIYSAMKYRLCPETAAKAGWPAFAG